MPPRSIAQVIPAFRALTFAELPPAFLAPALHRSFSSSGQRHSRNSSDPASPKPALPKPALSFRRRKPTSRSRSKDHNPNRGVSAIHRTGPRQPSRWYELPVPKEVKRESATEENKKHGLWEFFYSYESSLVPPADEYSHGK